MKKLTFVILILLSFFSCSNESNKVIEEVLTRHVNELELLMAKLQVEKVGEHKSSDGFANSILQ